MSGKLLRLPKGERVKVLTFFWRESNLFVGVAIQSRGTIEAIEDRGSMASEGELKILFFFGILVVLFLKTDPFLRVLPYVTLWSCKFDVFFSLDYDV